MLRFRDRQNLAMFALIQRLSHRKMWTCGGRFVISCQRVACIVAELIIDAAKGEGLGEETAL